MIRLKSLMLRCLRWFWCIILPEEGSMSIVEEEKKKKKKKKGGKCKLPWRKQKKKEQSVLEGTENVTAVMMAVTPAYEAEAEAIQARKYVRLREEMVEESREKEMMAVTPDYEAKAKAIWALLKIVPSEEMVEESLETMNEKNDGSQSKAKQMKERGTQEEPEALESEAEFRTHSWHFSGQQWDQRDHVQAENMENRENLNCHNPGEQVWTQQHCEESFWNQPTYRETILDPTPPWETALDPTPSQETVLGPTPSWKTVLDPASPWDTALTQHHPGTQYWDQHCTGPSIILGNRTGTCTIPGNNMGPQHHY